jgi:hypothetical protein
MTRVKLPPRIGDPAWSPRAPPSMPLPQLELSAELGGIFALFGGLRALGALRIYSWIGRSIACGPSRLGLVIAFVFALLGVCDVCLLWVQRFRVLAGVLAYVGGAALIPVFISCLVWGVHQYRADRDECRRHFSVKTIDAVVPWTPRLLMAALLLLAAAFAGFVVKLAIL